MGTTEVGATQFEEKGEEEDEEEVEEDVAGGRNRSVDQTNFILNTELLFLQTVTHNWCHNCFDSCDKSKKLSAPPQNSAHIRLKKPYKKKTLAARPKKRRNVNHYFLVSPEPCVSRPTVNPDEKFPAPAQTLSPVIYCAFDVAQVKLGRGK